MSNEEQSTLTRVEGKVAQVIELLSGNPLDAKDNGIIGRQHDNAAQLKLLDTKIDKVESKVNKYLAMGTGMAALCTMVFTVIGIWIEYRIMINHN